MRWDRLNQRRQRTESTDNYYENEYLTVHDMFRLVLKWTVPVLKLIRVKLSSCWRIKYQHSWTRLFSTTAIYFCENWRTNSKMGRKHFWNFGNTFQNTLWADFVLSTNFCVLDLLQNFSLTPKILSYCPVPKFRATGAGACPDLWGPGYSDACLVCAFQGRSAGTIRGGAAFGVAPTFTSGAQPQRRRKCQRLELTCVMRTG